MLGLQTCAIAHTEGLIFTQACEHQGVPDGQERKEPLGRKARHKQKLRGMSQAGNLGYRSVGVTNDVGRC